MSERHWFRQFLPLLALLLVTSCRGQVKEGAATSRDTTAAYAPKSITRNVLQDRSGRFWFATWEGIISYDGKGFTNVTLNEGLEKFRVFSVLEDAAGVLWFGTITGGVYRCDGRSFVRYTTADGLPHNSILCMLQDDVGNIWFGTDSGASRYDGKSFTNFAIQDGPAINVNSMVQDSTGKIWFATRYGVESDLYSYDGRSFTPVQRTPGSRFWNVRSVIVDGSGTMWIGGQDGLVRYDGRSFAQISTHFIGYIFEDSAGALWLSEDSPGDGWTLKRSDGTSATTVATSSMFFGITEDASDNIWFGTMDGIGRYDGKMVTRFTN